MTLKEFMFEQFDLENATETVSFTKDKLEPLKSKLLELSEFRSVKELNFIDTKEIKMNKEDGLMEYNTPTSVEKVRTYDVKEGSRMFNELVDIHKIVVMSEQPKHLTIDNLDYGTWRINDSFLNNNSLDVVNTVVLRYNWVSLKSIEDKKRMLLDLLRKTKELIESNEYNFPKERSVLVKCTDRSIRLSSI